MLRKQRHKSRGRGKAQVLLFMRQCYMLFNKVGDRNDPLAFVGLIQELKWNRVESERIEHML